LPLPPTLALFSHRECHPPSDSRRHYSCHHHHRYCRCRTVAVVNNDAMLSVLPLLLPLASRHGHDLLAPQKSILVDILLNRKTILARRHALWQEGGNTICVSAYLHICGPTYHKKIRNNH